MIEIDPTKHRFLETLQGLYDERKVGSGPLHPFRSTSWQKFLQTELPSRKAERFRHFPFRELYLESLTELNSEILLHPEIIEEEVLPECKGASIVVVNGRLCPHLCNLSALDKKPVLSSIDKAAYSYEMLLAGRYQKLLAHENDPFILMNAALSREGGFLYIPPNMQITRPIQILHFIAGKAGNMGLIHPQWHIFVGNNAKVDLVQTQHFLRRDSSVWVNQAMDVSLEEGAQFSLISDSMMDEKHYLFSTTKITQKRKSFASVISATSGSKGMRQQIESTLMGEEARADLNGFWLGSDDRHAHTVCSVRHEAPNTTSNQLFKGILRDKSLSSFEGKIFVAKEAQQTAAYQLNKNLLIGEGAKAYTKPNLEIFADDVKASHGATVGYFCEEELFYLAARGIGKELATSLLSASFLQDIVEKIPLKSLRENYEERLSCPQ